jgi:type II secretory pathway pseudopilin PulG
VALIAIIAAYAIPVVLQARIAANEASAVSTLRTVTSVNSQYRTRFGSFASTLTNLFDAGLLDPAVANPFKAGYTFSYTGITSTTYSMTANPTNPDESGNRYFFVDTTGVIRFSYTGPANASDTPL